MGDGKKTDPRELGRFEQDPGASRPAAGPFRRRKTDVSPDETAPDARPRSRFPAPAPDEDEAQRLSGPLPDTNPDHSVPQRRQSDLSSLSGRTQPDGESLASIKARRSVGLDITSDDDAGNTDPQALGFEPTALADPEGSGLRRPPRRSVSELDKTSSDDMGPLRMATRRHDTRPDRQPPPLPPSGPPPLPSSGPPPLPGKDMRGRETSPILAPVTAVQLQKWAEKNAGVGGRIEPPALPKGRADQTKAHPSRGAAPPRGATAVISAGGGGGEDTLEDPPSLPRSSNPGDTVAERLGLPNLRTPISLVSLPGERPFDAERARRDGKYLLGNALGEGGMGRVLAARDLDMGRNVALKQLLDDFRHDTGFIRALLFEARISGQLEHPNIVPVHDIGTLSDGSVYYTMKLVGDLTLRDVLTRLREGDEEAEKEWSLTALLQVFRSICMATEYAHARGVIHRDLKPDNVMIGDFGEVQLMDWGIARILPQGPGEPAYFAGAEEIQGVIVGTPHYMSPEQAAGDTEVVDARSDVYSLGLILYQMLTRVLPYNTSTADAQIQAVLTEPVPPPSQRAPERNVHPELERICMKALSFDREGRYGSARELWADLEAFLEGRKEQERLARLAEAQIVVADLAADRYYQVRRELLELEESVRSDDLNASFFDPLPQRKAAWDRKLRAEHRRLLKARAFAEAVDGYNRALAHQPKHARARRSLAALYRSQANDAFQTGDDAAMVLYGDLAHAAVEATEHPHSATLHIRSYPEGAEVRVFELGDLDLEDAAVTELGTAPLTDVSLRPGSYLISASLPGCKESRIPIVCEEGDVRHVLVTLQPWSASLPMVGRTEILTEVTDALTACVADRRLTTMLVCGASGMGKGRLVAEFDAYLDRVPEVLTFVYAQCSSLHRRVPFWTTAQIMRHRAGIGPHDAPFVIRDKIESAVTRAFTQEGAVTLTRAEAAEAAEVARIIASLPGLCGRVGRPAPVGNDHAYKSFEVFEAMSAYLSRVTDLTPLVLTIRGADHLDRLTRDLLFHLAAALRDRPVFFLGFAREDTLGMQLQRTLELKPLELDAVRHQLTMLLRGPVQGGVVEMVHAKTEGNPFYVSEFARLLVARDWIRFNGRAWVPNEDAQSGFYLGSLDMRDLLLLNLEGLGASALELLQAAAVTGDHFWGEELAERLGRDLEGDLEELVNQEIVVPQPVSRFAECREYAFRQDVVQRSLYEMHDEEALGEAHRAIARWLAKVGEGTLADKALEARHLVRGGRPEEAQPMMDALAFEAAQWERADAPPWFDWPDDLRSGVFPGGDPPR